MAHRSSNQSGTPSWVELASTDVAASKVFYGELFGWEFQDNAATQDAVYTMCFLKGDPDNPIAAIMEAHSMGEAPGVDAPPLVSFWGTYVSVDDIDAAAERVSAASGQIIMAPFDVTPLDSEPVGKMAVFCDPAGAFLSLWQPMAHIGATRVSEPSTYCWSEINLPTDIAEVLGFYEQVFGWQNVTHSEMPIPYTEFKLGDTAVAGGMTITPEQQKQQGGDGSMPPHWAVYFGAVGKDVDATFARAQELGGVPLVAPMDIPGGRFATMMDPQGAVFSFCWMDDFDG